MAQSRQGILSLTIKDKGALYAAYMPFVKNGGLFIPTNKKYADFIKEFLASIEQIANGHKIKAIAIAAPGDLLGA